MFENMSTREKFVAFIAGSLMLSALAQGEPGLFVLLVMLSLAYTFRNTNDDQQQQSNYEYEEDYTYEPQIRRERPANTEQVHRHALKAVRNARLDPNDMKVLPVDLGLITFRGDENPVLHRNNAVEDDIDYVQPFVQLRVPVKAVGKIKFEIYDDTRQPVFIHEDQHQLERGRNLIIPSTRLPIHDEQTMDGRWELRITADNIVISRHVFEWRDGESVQSRVGEDGEISNELKAVLSESRLQPMSLDELLAYQEEEQKNS